MTETATQRNGHWLEQKAKVKELLSSEEYKTPMKKLDLNVKLSLVRQKAIQASGDLIFGEKKKLELNGDY